MEEQSNREIEIRKLLKQFGVKTDHAIQDHFESHPEIEQLRVRLVLVDLTEYAEELPEPRLHLEVEGTVTRE